MNLKTFVENLTEMMEDAHLDANVPVNVLHNLDVFVEAFGREYSLKSISLSNSKIVFKATKDD